MYKDISIKNIIFLIVILIFLLNQSIFGQQNNYSLQKKSKIEIPFKYTNGLIEIKVQLNGVELKFIFDTGAEHTILTNKSIASLLKLNITKEIEVFGADFSNKITAFITTPTKIVLFERFHKTYTKDSYSENQESNATSFDKRHKGKFIIKNTPILILSHDIFNYDVSENSIQGILGASFFSNSIVKIDYKKEVLAIYPHDYKINLKGYKEIPVEFKGHKPIIKTNIKINNQDSTVKARVLMDTGSSIPLLFLENVDTKFQLPAKTIIGQLGVGLGGNLMGYIGLINSFKIGQFEFSGQISKFQNLDSSIVSEINYSRDGIIGNDILKKFTIVIDNFRKKLYFKPNKEFYKPLKYDLSGISLYTTGKNHNKYFIKHIIKGSAADLVGLKEKDEIYSVQCFNYRFWTYNGIVNLFKKKEDKKIRLKVIRNGKKMKFTFLLKDMLK